MRAVTALFALVLAAISCAAAAGDFEDQLAAHFNAVQKRDLPALEKTLTSGKSLELIFPNGTRTATRAQYVAFHKDWFTFKTWTMRFDPISTIDAGDVRIVTVKTHFEDVEKGKPIASASWLTLTFRKEKGRWALIHDL